VAALFALAALPAAAAGEETIHDPSRPGRLGGGAGGRRGAGAGRRRRAGGAAGAGLDFDFGGRGGWAAARHPVDLVLPASYEIRFTLRGEGTANHLELKLVDPSGDNVWWHVERDLEWPAEWMPVRIPQRRISFAWGPLGGGEPGRLGAIEIAVTAGGGGRGSIAIADLAVVPVEPLRPPDGPPRASATSDAPGHAAAAALDGDRGTAWRPAESVDGAAELTVDLRGRIELGGLSLVWEAGRAPERFRIELSADGAAWEALREVESAGAPESHLRLPETEASLLRLRLDTGDCPAGCGLGELIVRPLDFGESPNAFFSALAREAPRGAYPRGFTGEAVYWTVVGLPGDPEEALFSEDGAFEVGEKGFSLEPFLFLEGEGERKLWTWADVEAEQSLDEGDLPLPTVTWRLPGARLEIAALPVGDPRHAAFHTTLLALYRVVNEGTVPLRGRLLLAARPFQVNPPHQFLNVAGGVAPIGSVGCLADGLRVDGERRLWTGRPADGCGAIAFDEGRLTEALAAGALPAAGEVTDPVEAASAALAWELDVAPGASSEVVVAAPLSPEARSTPPLSPPPGHRVSPAAWSTPAASGRRPSAPSSSTSRPRPRRWCAPCARAWPGS
jgi:hypothetical protein